MPSVPSIPRKSATTYHAVHAEPCAKAAEELLKPEWNDEKRQVKRGVLDDANSHADRADAAQHKVRRL